MSLRAAASSAVLLAGLAGCDGCKDASKLVGGDASGGEAGTDAAASVSSVTGAPADGGAPGGPRDKTLVAVAEGSADVKLFPTFDGRIVLVSGSMPFEAKANGELEPLVSNAALAALYPDDDTFVGFLEPSMSVQWVRGDLGTPGRLFLDGWRGRVRKTFAVRDGKLVAATAPFEAHHVARWRGKLLGGNFGMKPHELRWLEDTSEPAPASVAKISNINGLAVDAQGALVVLSFASYERIRAAVFPATWRPGEAPAVVEGEQHSMCSVVPSFDASVVLRCAQSSPSGGGGTKFLRVSAAGFERVFPDAPQEIGAASIGKDGALYVTRSKKLALERCPAPPGRCTPIDAKTDFEPLETAQYEHDVSDVVERKGEFEMGDRSWSTVKVETAPVKDALAGAFSMVARDEHDVWILARNYRRGVVFHSTDDPNRERTRLPSQLDGRFVAKNANPPQAWTGHCEQVFVRLAAEDAKRGADLEKTLGSKSLAYDAPYHWWVVEGRLHEDEVTGVIIVRRDVEEPLDKLERAAERLMDAFTPNPMNKPKAYCTLPVIERVIHQSKP